MTENPFFARAAELTAAWLRPGSGEVVTLDSLEAAPDGLKIVAAATVCPSLEGELRHDGTTRTRIAMVDLSSGEVELRTDGIGSDAAPTWSPDGRYVAYISDRDEPGVARLRILDVGSGLDLATADVDGFVESAEWSADGRRILLGVAGHGSDAAGVQGAVALGRVTDRRPWAPTVEGVDEPVPWRGVWLHDIADGITRRVSPKGTNVWSGVWCGPRHIAAICSDRSDEGAWYGADVRLIDVEGGDVRTLYMPEDQVGGIAASPSGATVAVAEAVCSDRDIVAGDLRLIDVAHGTVTGPPTLDADLVQFVWRDEERLLVVALRGPDTLVGLHDTGTGATAELWRGRERTISGAFLPRVAPLGSAPTDLVMMTESFFDAPTLCALESGHERTVREFLSPDTARTVAGLGTATDFTWTTEDGVELHGWLVAPASPGPHPLIVQVHGGPVLHTPPAYVGRSALAQLALAESYALFQPNVRGSCGLGQAATRLLVGDVGGVDARDHLAALDALVAAGLADPDRRARPDHPPRPGPGDASGAPGERRRERARHLPAGGPRRPRHARRLRPHRAHPHVVRHPHARRINRPSQPPGAGPHRRGPLDMTEGHSVITEFDVEATMRDGVILRANVFRPDAEGTFPVLLARTPYDKNSPGEAGHGFDPLTVARFGFIVVVQDVRGRYASEGEWEAMRNERADGYDSVEWAAGLPGSSGRVGMYGASYVGTTQWGAAVENPPSLKAIAPALTWKDMADGVVRRGGAVDLGLPSLWTLMQGFDHLARSSTPEEHPARYEALAQVWDDLHTTGCWELPAAELPFATRVGLSVSSMSPEVSAPSTYTDADFDRLDKDLAVAVTGAWYDFVLQGTLDTYVAARSRGLDARLHVGPWTHENPRNPVGQRFFGLRSSRETFLVDYSESWLLRHLTWFKRHLGPSDAVPLAEKRVRIFVMGRNEWRDEDDWPLARAEDERWYLHADGSLSPRASADERAGVREFVYDPTDPVPTMGGNTACMPAHPAGPYDQAPVEAREDVLVYTSAPLEEDLEVTGHITARLTMESSAPSTDWVARLCDVDEQGRSWNLCDGIVRVAEGADELRQVEIDLWSTSNVFLRGHRLRVHVTSSSFPRWDRNLNTGDQTAAAMTRAAQRVHHGAEGSWLELPVVRD